MTPDAPHGIAIIGMACRFPGASTPAEFWQNLRSGTESITTFTDDELLAAGVDASLLRHPDYVKASPILRQADMFDAAFFGYSPKEAAIMDPQHRLFLETCWEAFEDAGYDPEAHADRVIGVFAGAGSALTSYLLAMRDHPDMQGQTAGVQHITNDNDFLATRVSYKLNLTGPSLTVQTACSTSLVAVHLAVQSLLNGECDVALAGASTVRVPHISGYLAERGSVHSADGHCRSFDAAGVGTIFGSGVGAVLLKPLDAAIEDGDHVYAVVKGTAITNDGAGKISYTAAGTVGQARAIVEALEAAAVSADTIGYVECHATGTAAGDPVEIQALTRAFRLHTKRTAFCAVGSVKTNIGHPEQAAGMAGLIKTALALEHGELPPTVHFSTANPSIPFAGSPFYVQTALGDWPSGQTPRRAGVNSLGIGGTNAFVVLESAPAASGRPREQDAGSNADAEPRHHLFPLSAKSADALRAQAARMAEWLASTGHALADICHTAAASRTAHQVRLAVTGRSTGELRAKLLAIAGGPPEGGPHVGDGGSNVGRPFTGRRATVTGNEAAPRAAKPDRAVHRAGSAPPPVAFLFSGQGTQYAGMSRDLYGTMPRFRDVVQQCDAALRPHLGTSIIDVLFAGDAGRLTETRFAQPALFTVEYALAEQWRAWGVTPAAVMGHSVGEVVAACVAGVLDFQDAAAFVAARGRVMQESKPGGAMEVFFADEETVRHALASFAADVSVAAVNGPRQVVVSGAGVAVAAVRDALAASGIQSTRLDVSHAFHSPLLDDVLPALEASAATLSSRAPRIPFIANATGRPHEAAPSAAYWRDHARQPVRFRDGMLALHDLGIRTFLEIGPGASSIALGRECLPDDGLWLESISRRKGDVATILASAGQLYCAGVPLDWTALAAGQRWQRVPLPTYPFERKRYWLGSGTARHARLAPARDEHPPSRRAVVRPGTPIDREPPPSIDSCLYHLTWSEQFVPDTEPAPGRASVWLVFADTLSVGTAIARHVEQRGDFCHLVKPGTGFTSPRPRRWTIDPRVKEDYDALLAEVRRGERGRLDHVVYLWALDAPATAHLTFERLQESEEGIARGALCAVQALAASRATDDSTLWLVTRNAQRVHEHDTVCEPAQALLWGLGRTVALEAPHVWGGTIDLGPAGRTAAGDAEAIVHVVRAPGGDQQIAVRGRQRFVPRIERLIPRAQARQPLAVRADATYLITGGSGMLGLTIARWLVEDKGARSLALAFRSQPSAEAAQRIRQLEALGARIRVMTADVTQDSDVQRLAATLAGDGRPLKGVVHCAGVLADGIVTQMTWDTFVRATGPKVRGGWLLHHHLRDVELDFFVVQSSLLSLTGSAAQANYTAANAFLDALIDHRHALGLPGMAINWGPWGGAGMAVSAGQRGEAMWRTRGVGFIPPALGIEALETLFEAGPAHAAVAICDWERQAAQARRSALVYAKVLTTAAAVPRTVRSTPASPLAAQLASAPRETRRNVLLEALRDEVSGELELDGVLDTSLPLRQLGVDSLMSVNLANRLEGALGLKVPIAMLVSGPSLDDLSEDLLGQLDQPSADPGSTPIRPPGTPPAGPPPRAERRGEWLVVPRPNRTAALRLFCFNYAGGGASPFQPWATRLSPSIELVIVEPPGRGSRIHESPITRLDALLDRLLPEMRPYLDRPCAFFGHCLGALTLYETARRLLRDGFPDLLRLFVSGARTPDRIATSGSFEEELLGRLLADPGFDTLRPFYEQPDDTFASMLRQFNIWATDDMLEQRELRTLLLPAIRADFEIAATYRHRAEGPWNVPITCFAGLDDAYVTREQAIEWNRHTRREFRMHLRHSNHFLVVEDRDFIVATINAELASALESERRA